MVEGRRKSGGGKLTRSETVTVRLDPKLRYLAELGVSIANQMHQAGLHPPPQKPFVKLDCMPFIPAIGTQLQKLAFSSYPAYQERLARLREMIPPEYASEVEISAAMDETTHLLQAFMERNTAQAGEVLWETWRGAPAGILTAPLLRDALARAGFDLDQLREEYFRKPLPYEILFSATTCTHRDPEGVLPCAEPERLSSRNMALMDIEHRYT